jgi:hypothetical protein
MALCCKPVRSAALLRSSGTYPAASAVLVQPPQPGRRMTVAVEVPSPIALLGLDQRQVDVVAAAARLQEPKINDPLIASRSSLNLLDD